MSASINIVGRLSKDPESKTVGGGHSLCNLSIPVDVGYGEKKETTWYNVTVWGKQGEKAAQYLRKGSWVSISGEFKVRTWDKEGGKGFSAEVNCDRWSFVGPKQEATTPNTTGPAGGSSGGGSYSDPSSIPF